MKDERGLSVDALVREIQESAKYRHVSPDLIRRVGGRELANRRNLKEAVKETKNTLHQIAGAFLDPKMRYDAWLQQLQQAATSNTDAISNEESSSFILHPSSLSSHPSSFILHPFRIPCADIMTNHASTRERLPLLDTFYAQTLEAIAPVRSVLDLCCGLNPLALPWMPLAPDVTYHACDLYGDMMAFLNGFFALAGINGVAEVCDVVHAPPTQPVQLALLLKALPPLEQTDKHATLRLLHALNAEHILVSFPTRTLGGRNKQMGGHYETRFRALLADEPESRHWQLQRFAFANELCFLVSKE